MEHSFFTGSALGSRAIYDTIGGTDSLSLGVNDSTGTYTVVSNTSSYGSTALRVDTTAVTGDLCTVRTYNPSSQTERRGNLIIDMPALSSGQFIAVLNEGNTGGSFFIHLYNNGSWAVFANGVAQYTSGTGILPAAGTRIRIAYALAINGASSTWRANIFVDTTNAAVGSERTGTVTWSGSLWSNTYIGKTLGQSATTTSVLVRGFRLEHGTGCGLALLPAEEQLTPAEGTAVIPIRLVSYQGTAPNPAGAAAITHLADGDDSTTISIATGTTLRVAFRPMSPVGPYLTFNLYQMLLSAAGSITVTLWRGRNNTQIGTAKTVSVGTTAANSTVTFDATELNGLTTADWEAIEMELIVP